MIDQNLQAKILFSSQLTTNDIIKIFSYSADESEVFPDLRRYMKLIDKRLDEIENDEEKLQRFALAGLFLTYRACNHSGSSMETANLDDLDSGIHKTRLNAFRDYFKAEIKSIDHYLRLVNFSVFDYVLLIFRLQSLSRKLYKFVVK